MTTVEQAPDRRVALIAGLRDLADWLEANPEVPVGRYPHLEYTYFPEGDDDAELAEVARVADLIGEEIQTNSKTNSKTDRRWVTKPFGPVAYKAIAISASAMAKHEAASTYFGAVEPDMVGAR